MRGRRIQTIALAFLILVGCDVRETATPNRTIDGDPEVGRKIIAKIACGVCHTIPGVNGARGTVGPSLQGFGNRAYIAGVVPNGPLMLVQWVRDAPSLAPNTAMPRLPLTEEEARHVAAYLYTLK